jgi:hypothetical protein
MESEAAEVHRPLTPREGKLYRRLIEAGTLRRDMLTKGMEADEADRIIGKALGDEFGRAPEAIYRCPKCLDLGWVPKQVWDGRRKVEETRSERCGESCRYTGWEREQKAVSRGRRFDISEAGRTRR